MTSIEDWLERGSTALKQAGIDNPRQEMRRILSHATGHDPAYLIAWPEREVESDDTVEAMLARRCSREPLSRIIGLRHFWRDRFEIGPGVLDPRADTETLVEGVLDHFKGTSPPRRIADIGTGSGCILLSLLREYPDATGVGIDISEAALSIARRNARSLGLSGRVEFRLSNWFDALESGFDVIVSNPPYIPKGDIPGLQPEVRDHDPVLSLDGGDDGLDVYRLIAVEARRHLVKGGLLALEVGQGQAFAVRDLLRQAGWTSISTRTDLSATERSIFAMN